MCILFYFFSVSFFHIRLEFEDVSLFESQRHWCCVTHTGESGGVWSSIPLAHLGCKCTGYA